MNILPNSDYQKFVFESSLKIYRILLLFVIVFYGLFIIQDYISFPGTIYQAFVMRFLVIIPVFFLCFGLTFTSLARRWLKYLASISFIAAEAGACYLLAINKTPDAQFIYFGSTMLIMVAAHSVIWQGYLFNGVTSLVMIISYSLTTYFYIEPVAPLLNQVELLLTAMAFGTTANYFIDLHLHNEYSIAKELTVQKNKAVKATQLKDKFVSLVSHDLRGPIGSFQGLMELIHDQKREDGLYGKDVAKFIRMGEGIINGLIEMINKLLDISRLQTGEIAPIKRFFDARSLIEERLLEVSLLAESKNIELVNEAPNEGPKNLRLFGDADLIGEALLNLLSNAVKFSKSGGKITVFSPDKTRIAVKDNGTGIDPKLLPNIFKHEVKTTSMGTSGETGTGLGLPHCRDIMAAHGGDIRAESSAEGTTFYLEFPKEKSIVLIVDDQEVQRELMKEYLLKISDIEVMEAGDGFDALVLINDTIPDLIITDLNMPEMDGLELIRRIRENHPPDTLPIVVSTALSSSSPYKGKVIDIRSEALALGANDFITKPIIPEDFIPRIKRLIV